MHTMFGQLVGVLIVQVIELVVHACPFDDLDTNFLGRVGAIAFSPRSQFHSSEFEKKGPCFV